MVRAARAAVGTIVLRAWRCLRATHDRRERGSRSAFRQAIWASPPSNGPSFQRRLTPIDAGLRQVTVVTLTTKTDDPVEPSVALAPPKGVLRLEPECRPHGQGQRRRRRGFRSPSESRPACKGAQDPVLALEQLLGTRRRGASGSSSSSASPWNTSSGHAPADRISARRECSFALPTQLLARQARQAVEETQLFVFGQMWSSYVADFPTPGYPFTGMGWTYNWNPASKDHSGDLRITR